MRQNEDACIGFGGLSVPLLTRDTGVRVVPSRRHYDPH